MDSRYDFSPFIDDKNGETVGCLYDQKEGRKFSYHGIAFKTFVGHFIDKMNHVGMDLIEEDQLEIFPFWSSCQVFFFPVSRSETVEEKWNLLEARKNEKFTRR